MEPIEERLRRKMMSVLDEAQKLAFSKYRSIMDSPAADSPISSSVKAGAYLLDTTQNPIPRKISQNTLNNDYQPSSPPLLLGPNLPLSFSDLDIPQVHESQLASSNTSEHAATTGEEHTTLTRTETKADTKSTSNTQSPSNPATNIDDSLPLLDHELFGSDPALIWSDGAENLALFSDNWDLNSDKLDLGILNWNPSWNTTSTARST
jgi:hypothetical protein